MGISRSEEYDGGVVPGALPGCCPCRELDPTSRLGIDLDCDALSCGAGEPLRDCVVNSFSLFVLSICSNCNRKSLAQASSKPWPCPGRFESAMKSICSVVSRQSSDSTTPVYYCASAIVCRPMLKRCSCLVYSVVNMVGKGPRGLWLSISLRLRSVHSLVLSNRHCRARLGTLRVLLGLFPVANND